MTTTGIADFQVGSIITHYNDKCIIGWTNNDLQKLYREESILSLQYVTNLIEYQKIVNEITSGLKKKDRLVSNMTPDAHDKIKKCLALLINLSIKKCTNSFLLKC